MTYIFYHIPKTAGTTFKFAYLMSAFPAEEMAFTNRDEMQLSMLPEEKRRKLKIVAGHDVECLRPVFSGARWLTVLRDPVDRAVSVYLHARHHPDAWEMIGREVNENNVSLEQFVEDDLHYNRNGEPGSVHDQQARIVLGESYDESLLQDKVALTRLIQSRFHLSGYTEAFELFLFVLHMTEGFPLVLFNNRLVRKERATFVPSPEALAAIRRYNRADRIVYDCVREEFHRRVAEIWTAENARLYERYLQALQAFRGQTGGGPQDYSTIVFAAGNQGGLAPSVAS